MMNRMITFWSSNPILIRTDKFYFVWFGVIIGVIIAMAIPTLLYATYYLPESKYSDFFFEFFIWWPIFAVGGSIFLFHGFWTEIGRTIKKMLSKEEYVWRRPGAVFYGGFTGSAILILLLSLKHNLSFFYVLDFAFVIIPFFHGLSRLGCLNFGCCYGKECPDHTFLKVSYSHPESEPVKHGIPPGTNLYPTQLYEMFFCMLLGGILFFLLLGHVGEGRIFASYLIGYGLIRFFLEYVRDNSHVKIFYNAISIWQIASLVFVLIGVALWFVLPERPPLNLNNSFLSPNYTKIVGITLWNALAIAITFGIHFRKKGETL